VTTLSVLLVEDSPTDAKLVLHELGKLGRAIDSERVENAETMRAALVRRSCHLVLSDWSMPRFSAPAALSVVKELELDIPFIIVSGTIGEETAVEAMRAGAHDYILKDKLARLTPVIERELRECGERAARRRAEQALRESEVALRRSEEQLRQSQKMEAVGRLAGGVAHDFNNVLSVILSYGDLILADLKEEDPVRLDVREICAAGRRAAGLTRQLLLFSRQDLVEARVLDVNQILIGMDKMLQRVLGEDVELTSLIRATGRVSADQSHVEQVILNLVVNARDAMPTGGKLTIETADVALDEHYALGHLPAKPGNYVMLAVSDTGTGMDKATQARIFEPFFTTKDRDKGTGLGLSTVFGIVQQSGGTIWVYSEPGQGTTFKIYLPRADGELASEQPPTSPASLLGSETILLVEDEGQVRTVTASILRRYGYQVIIAHDGRAALLACEQHPTQIDLLLSDVVMPRMSGPELAKQLAPLRPKMKILFMSGYADDSVLRHGLLETGAAYLQKPITAETLGKKVREALGKSGGE
jgi:signal transduction histidine kinase